MKRVVFALPPVTLAALAALSTLACKGNVTRAECTGMLDRYIDMTVAYESGGAELPEAEARDARDAKKALRKGALGYAQKQNQCEVEISRHEYRCAIKAPTPETWQACID